MNNGIEVSTSGYIEPVSDWLVALPQNDHTEYVRVFPIGHK